MEMLVQDYEDLSKPAYTLIAQDVAVGQFVERDDEVICFKMHDKGYTSNPSYTRDMTHDLMVETKTWTKGWCSASRKFRALSNKQVVFRFNKDGK